MDGTADGRQRRRPRKATPNPIRAAVTNWMSTLTPSATQKETTSFPDTDTLLNSAPKRFTIYEPMVLLPTGSFTSAAWSAELSRREADTCTTLWAMILEELSRGSKTRLTHLAVNEGIPLRTTGEEDENVLRSPSRLRMLYGDYGPSQTSGDVPTATEFCEALWVTTKQNGILQTWAPRWTMFSRGNVKEKARLLDFKLPPQDNTAQPWAVDLYAGIGYFTLSYAALGMRVLCWEINPWSVEGLRRGAEQNRWTVKVVQGADLALATADVVGGGEHIVVFLEDNQRALGRIRDLQTQGVASNIRHVNCGFLPTSEPVWRHAWDVTSLSPEARLHLHENVGSPDKEARALGVQRMLEGWSSEEGSARRPRVEHVESVKTFAPGVEHVVFDVHVTRSDNIGT